jgi:hypothetical protein
MPWMQKVVPVALLDLTGSYTWACCHPKMLIEWFFRVDFATLQMPANGKLKSISKRLKWVETGQLMSALIETIF